MDVSDIFYFFCSGRRKGESEAPGSVGGRFFIENARRLGGFSLKGGGGAEGPGGCLWRIGELGEGGQFFFSGLTCPSSECAVKRIASEWQCVILAHSV